MAILLEQIASKKYIRTLETIGKVEITEARLILVNEYADSNNDPRPLTKIPSEQIEYFLKRSILNHIYGDLIQPFNRLIGLCKRNAENNKDFDEIDKLIKQISHVLHGQEQSTQTKSKRH